MALSICLSHFEGRFGKLVGIFVTRIQDVYSAKLPSLQSGSRNSVPVNYEGGIFASCVTPSVTKPVRARLMHVT